MTMTLRRSWFGERRSIRRAVNACKPTAFGIFLLFALSCGSPTESTAVPFRVVYASELGGPAFEIRKTITSDAEWRRIWESFNVARSSEPPPRPVVDFSSETLIVTAAGEKPDRGTASAIVSITRRRAMLDVRVVDSQVDASAGCVLLPQNSYPVSIVAIPSDNRGSAARFQITSALCRCWCSAPN